MLIHMSGYNKKNSKKKISDKNEPEKDYGCSYHVVSIEKMSLKKKREEAIRDIIKEAQELSW